MKTRVQVRSAKPARFEDAAFSRAGRLNPAQRFGAATAIVGGEKQIPQSQCHDCPGDVDEQQANHNASSDADGNSEVAAEARGQSIVLRLFLLTKGRVCGKRSRLRASGFGLSAFRRPGSGSKRP